MSASVITVSDTWQSTRFRKYLGGGWKGSEPLADRSSIMIDPENCKIRANVDLIHGEIQLAHCRNENSDFLQKLIRHWPQIHAACSKEMGVNLMQLLCA